VVVERLPTRPTDGRGRALLLDGGRCADDFGDEVFLGVIQVLAAGAGVEDVVQGREELRGVPDRAGVVDVL
jgi:hypothetical protein